MASPLRILHVASGDTWGGAEAQVALLAPAQGELGHAVRVVTFAKGRLSRILIEKGVGTAVFPESAGTRRLLTSLWSELGFYRPDIVHAHGYKEAILSFAAGWFRAGACVRTLHGVPELPLGGSPWHMRLYETLEHLAAQAAAAHWIAVSRDIFERTRRRMPSRVHYVPNAVDPRPPAGDADRLRSELGLFDTRVLLFAGRLEPIKGPDLLLEAFRDIQREIPNVVLLLAGEGSLRITLEHAARAEGLHGVRMLGEREDIPDLLRLADVVVLPSRGEGMPTLLLEALAAGRAVVATRVGAIPEVTHEGRFARLVPPADPAALASACVEVLSNVDLRNQLTSRAPETIRRDHGPAHIAAATERVYRAALS